MRPVAGLAWAMLACALLMWHTGASALQEPPVSTFRSAVDVVQLDVSVLDRDHHPVRGLTAADFTVFEDGRPQTIIAFQAFDVPDLVIPRTTWMREVAPDVTDNHPFNGRLVVVVLDDLIQRVVNRNSYWTDVWTTATSSRVVETIMNQVGPEDLVSVVYTEENDRAQDFTADRARIRAAISSFVGRRPTISLNRYKGSCGPVPPSPSVLVLDELLRVSAALQSEPQRRKTILLVSPGFRVRTENGRANTCEDLLSKQLQREAQQANINIYGIDPGSPPGDVVARQDTLDDLKMLAESTGGRLILDTKNDDPEARVPGIFEENSSYYLLGFRSSAAKGDGRFRRLDVTVNRPGVEVRTRSGYYAGASASRSASKRPAAPASPLDESVTGLLPMTETPLRVSVAPFAIAGKPGAAVALTIGVQQPASDARAGGPMLSVLAHAYDLDGNSVASKRTTMDLGSVSSTNPVLQYDILLRLDVPPGRYEIRVGTETSTRRRGSVYAYADVPNYTKEPLSVSGLMLERTPASPAAPKAALAAVVPVLPTTTRLFAQSDVVHAFIRVYQGRRGPLAAALVSARIVNDRGEAVLDEATTLNPGRFDEKRAADYTLNLPLARLAPGEYLLTVETTLDSHRERRDVRFTVK